MTYDASSVLALFCKSYATTTPIQVTAVTNEVTIVFKTDGATVEKGFELSWESSNQPGGLILTCDNPFGNLSNI